jgi:hypothetical protein
MQEIKDYINLEDNNFLSLFVEPKINIKSTYLTDNEKLYLKKITNENRKQEFLQIRALRNKSIGEIEIDYTESGKPFLVNSKEYISLIQIWQEKKHIHI